MNKSMKDISATQLQDVIAKALSDLTGKACVITVSEVRYETSVFESLAGGESLAFSAKASLKTVTAVESVPF